MSTWAWLPGYTPDNPPEWIDALRPQLILLSVGAEGKVEVEKSGEK